MSRYDNWEELKNLLTRLTENDKNGKTYYEFVLSEMEKMEEPQKRELNYFLFEFYLEFYSQEPTAEIIEQVTKEVPEDLKRQADMWGWNDTEVRDYLYVWMRTRAKRTKEDN